MYLFQLKLRTTESTTDIQNLHVKAELLLWKDTRKTQHYNRYMD